MQRRLQSIEETRRRITAATFDLHATVGPSRTTISAIADRAGVQRHTVYAHFPDLDTLYRACTEHGMLVTRMPLPEPWAAIGDPMVRLRTGLDELFKWYRANERMLRNVLADAGAEAQGPSAGRGPEAETDLFETRMTALVDALAHGWPVSGASRPRLLRAVLVHATAFETWRSLTITGLRDEEAVDLLGALAVAVADGSIVVGEGD